MNKRILLFCGILTVLTATVWWALGSQPATQEPETERIQIVTTLFPLYDFTRNIGGEYADVTLLLPPGVEAHHFEPKPSDLTTIRNAAVFIYTGQYMEPWVETILSSIDDPDLQVIDASSNIHLIDAVSHDDDELEGTPDPHIWMDFDYDLTIVDMIRDALVASDPVHQPEYSVNAETLKQSLRDLDEAYSMALYTCPNKTIVYGGHFALGYLAKRYNLTYLAAQGIAPDSEPSANDLTALIDDIRNHNITTVYYEELTSPKIAETIAAETDAQLLELSAAHNVSRDDIDRGVTFIQIMQQNLTHLMEGQQCQNL